MAEWEVVWFGDGEAQAEIVAGGLEAAGIRAHTEDRPFVTGSLLQSQTRGWAVRVRAPDAPRARRLLRRRGERRNVVSGPSSMIAENARVITNITVTATLLAVIVGGIWYILGLVS